MMNNKIILFTLLIVFLMLNNLEAEVDYTTRITPAQEGVVLNIMPLPFWFPIGITRPFWNKSLYGFLLNITNIKIKDSAQAHHDLQHSVVTCQA